jgi:hypothetical protein
MASRRAAEESETSTFTLIVLRSSGGRSEITIDSSKSLKDLKTAISESKALGQPAPADQRIFHMGRELKSNGRTLEKLGFCKWGIPVVHVHARADASTTSHQEMTLEVADSSENDSDYVLEVVCDPSTNKRPTGGGNGVIDLAESEDEGSSSTAPTPSLKRRRGS